MFLWPERQKYFTLNMNSYKQVTTLLLLQVTFRQTYLQGTLYYVTESHKHIHLEYV